jgi:hypothetical protein
MQTAPITVYSQFTSPRLLYVLDWLFTEVLHTGYVLTTSEEDVLKLPFFVTYGKPLENALFIPAAGLLQERDIRNHNIKTGEWQDIPTMYAASGAEGMPFDLFSAIFFLLSRYEEYYNYTPDKHGRYPVKESTLYKHGWLRRPLVDEWILFFAELLNNKYGIAVALDDYKLQCTYDIDIAYSYKHKGWKRTAGGIAKDALHGNGGAVMSRALTLLGQKEDPFDSFFSMQSLHSKLGIKPRYFILSALEATAYDKNISPRTDAMVGLIKRLGSEGEIGLHPSYYSTKEEIFAKEKAVLEEITGISITHSRQHYIRLSIPETYQKLLKMGMCEDWTMGYGSKLGFRAGTGRSFYWYDLQEEKATPLRIHPFCFMDSTAHFEEKLTVNEAFKVLVKMRDALVKTRSVLTLVFHNFSLGNDEQWSGWARAYQQFVEQEQP